MAHAVALFSFEPGCFRRTGLLFWIGLVFWTGPTPLFGQAPSPALERATELHLAGNLQAARRAYLEVLAAEEPLPPMGEAQARNNLCVLLPELGDHAAAVEHCRRAVDLRRRADDPVPLARALNNLGIALLYTGRAGEAGDAFTRALALNERHGETAAAADNLTHLGLVAEAEGRLTDALDLHRRSEELALAEADRPWSASRRLTAVINRGVALEKLGQYRAALELYRGLLDHADPTPRQRARLLVNTAVLYRNLDDPTRAVDLLEEADALFRELDDATGRVDVWLNLGQIRHLHFGRPEEAEADYGPALELARSSGDRHGEIQALYLLGELLRDADAPARARASFEQCLELTADDRRPEARWSAHAGLAELASRQGDHERAVDHAERAMEVVETVRRGLRGPSHRGSFFQGRRQIYSIALEVFYAREQALGTGDGGARSLAVVQRAKERELLAALRRDPADSTDAFEPTPFLERLGTRGFAEYWSAGDRLYVWVLPPSAGGHRDLSALRWTRAEGADALERAVTRLHRQLSAGGEDPALEDLGRALLGPLDPRPGSEWLLAPDARLRYLPFEMLPLPGRPDLLLVDAARLSYLPSASALAALDRPSRPRAYRFVGLADAVPSPAARAWLGADVALPRLSAGAGEQAGAARRLGGESRLAEGVEAGEGLLRQRLAEGTDVLHLAAHAVVEERPGRGAALLLSGEADAAPERDGLLRPAEVADLPGDTDLTVLAACRSALGDEGDVGALGSLTGAFLASGSRGVVAGLWPVGDQSTAVFMDRFYARLAAGASPAEALADVKRELRADPRWNRPRLWAPWVLWGDPPAIRPRASNRFRQLWVPALIAVLALGAVGFAALRRRA